jgi:hypothetical protein
MGSSADSAVYHLEYDQYPEKHAYFIAKKI